MGSLDLNAHRNRPYFSPRLPERRRVLICNSEKNGMLLQAPGTLYQPFSSSLIPLVFYYIGVATFGVFMSLELTAKYRQRRVKAPLYLAIVFAIFTIAVAVLATGLVESWIDGVFGNWYRLTLPIGYSLIVVADVFLLLFTNEMVGQRGRAVLMIMGLVGAAIVVMLWLPWNFWGYVSGNYGGQVNIRTYSTLALVAYSFVIYIDIIVVAGKASAGAQDHVAKHGLQLIIVAMLCMIGFFVMMICDTLLIVLYNAPGYSIFVYFAWVFAIAFFIVMYLGLIMPPWFKKSLHH
jgi:hypothetical protein